MNPYVNDGFVKGFTGTLGFLQEQGRAKRAEDRQAGLDALAAQDRERELGRQALADAQQLTTFNNAQADRVAKQKKDADDAAREQRKRSAPAMATAMADMTPEQRNAYVQKARDPRTGESLGAIHAAAAGEIDINDDAVLSAMNWQAPESRLAGGELTDREYDLGGYALPKSSLIVGKRYAAFAPGKTPGTFTSMLEVEAEDAVTKQRVKYYAPATGGRSVKDTEPSEHHISTILGAADAQGMLHEIATQNPDLSGEQVLERFVAQYIQDGGDPKDVDFSAKQFEREAKLLERDAKKAATALAVARTNDIPKRTAAVAARSKARGAGGGGGSAKLSTYEKKKQDIADSMFGGDENMAVKFMYGEDGSIIKAVDADARAFSASPYNFGKTFDRAAATKARKKERRDLVAGGSGAATGQLSDADVEAELEALRAAQDDE